MALSGRSSLERTNGRPLCPRCRAPMWSVRFRPEKSADDKRAFQCPRCEVALLEAITKNSASTDKAKPPPRFT